jgi:hypothetical protein
MHRLTRDAQGVADFLPRPSLLSRERHVTRLDSLAESVERN